MEYTSNAKTLHRFFVSSPLSPLPDTSAVRRDPMILKAPNLLHERKFVFGDLRQLNILYPPEDDRAFLVDFDGVGKHKEDRYTPCLNTESRLCKLGTGHGMVSRVIFISRTVIVLTPFVDNNLYCRSGGRTKDGSLHNTQIALRVSGSWLSQRTTQATRLLSHILDY